MEVIGPFYIIGCVLLTCATAAYWITGGVVGPEMWRGLAVANALWIPIVAFMWAIDA